MIDLPNPFMELSACPKVVAPSRPAPAAPIKVKQPRRPTRQPKRKGGRK